MRSGGCRSGTDQRRQHRLELRLRLGELGERVAVGDDAATGREAGPAASADSSAQRIATAHVPSPAPSTHPTAPP